MSDKRLLNFHTKRYTGKKANLQQQYMRRIQDTNTVEQYLNSIQTDQPQIKTVFEIAQATGLGEENVRKILMENGHGYNGITF